MQLTAAMRLALIYATTPIIADQSARYLRSYVTERTRKALVARGLVVGQQLTEAGKAMRETLL